MRQLTLNPQLRIVPNAWGRDVTVRYVDYAIEAPDVGTLRPNYLGHGRHDYTFKPSDVGRIIRCDETPGGCWYFL